MIGFLPVADVLIQSAGGQSKIYDVPTPVQSTIRQQRRAKLTGWWFSFMWPKMFANSSVQGISAVARGRVSHSLPDRIALRSY